jgi:predicted DNA repair protein MutK
VGWLVNTLASALLGLLVGAAIVAVLSVTLHRRKAQRTGEATSH